MSRHGCRITRTKLTNTWEVYVDGRHIGWFRAVPGSGYQVRHRDRDKAFPQFHPLLRDALYRLRRYNDHWEQRGANE